MKQFIYFLIGIIASCLTLSTLKSHTATNFFTDWMIAVLVLWVFAMIGMRPKRGLDTKTKASSIANSVQSTPPKHN